MSLTMEERATIVRQIGPMNVAAISGGRVGAAWDENQEPVGIALPVAHGHRVEVILDRGSDTYIVRRVFKRGGKEWEKHRREYVHADEVGEAAYRASLYTEG